MLFRVKNFRFLKIESFFGIFLLSSDISRYRNIFVYCMVHQRYHDLNITSFRGIFYHQTKNATRSFKIIVPIVASKYNQNFHEEFSKFS